MSPALQKLLDETERMLRDYTDPQVVDALIEIAAFLPLEAHATRAWICTAAERLRRRHVCEVCEDVLLIPDAERCERHASWEEGDPI